MVSHDRYFLDRGVKRLFAFEGGSAPRQFEGGYSDYELVRQVETEEAGQTKEITGDKQTLKKADPNAGRSHAVKLKFTYQEQKDWEVIDERIASLEDKIEKLDREIAANARAFVKLGGLTREKEEAEGRLEEAMERWMYLSEKNEMIEAEKK